jgi:hypothetical protein
MRLQNTFLESILNREVIICCSCGSFAELLLDRLLYPSLLVVGFNHHHFSRILLCCILLNILNSSNMLRRLGYLHASLGSIPVTQDVCLVADRMRISLKQGVSDALIESV